MAKGKRYEIEVANAVKAELRQGNFGLDPRFAKVCRKPRYFSHDRKKDIIFDVSIEVFRRGVSIPYFVWVWECKDYRHTVPVDDVEEFHAKLEQIGADKTKGTMITPVGFDSGSVAYAKSKGIGLWRYIRQGSLVNLMEDRRGVAEEDILRALTTADTADFRFHGFFYGLSSDGHFTTDRDDLIRCELEKALDS